MNRAVTILIRDGDRILAVSRKDDPTAFGLPGGKVDPGETLVEAIVREVREETGLEVSELELIFERTDKNYHVFTFTPGHYSGAISTEEAGLVSWVSRDTLESGPFGKYNAILLDSLSDSG